MRLPLQSRETHHHAPSHPISSSCPSRHPGWSTCLSQGLHAGMDVYPPKWGCEASSLHLSDVAPQHSTHSHHCCTLLVYALTSEMKLKSQQVFLKSPTHRSQILRRLLLQRSQIWPPLILCAVITAQHFGGGGCKISKISSWGTKEHSQSLCC